jgi:hypothetical protein
MAWFHRKLITPRNRVCSMKINGFAAFRGTPFRQLATAEKSDFTATSRARDSAFSFSQREVIIAL